jgi:flagellar biosynthesis protein FlhF
MYATVRSFRAADSQQALAAVKAALGPDAVILSTREVSAGFLRRPEVEVTAATPEPPPPPAPPAGAATNTRVAAYRPAAEPALGPAGASAVPFPHGAEHPLAAELLYLRRAVEDARREIREASNRSAAALELRFAPAPASLHARLVDRGMEEALAEELVRRALPGTHDEGELESRIRGILAKKLVAGRVPWGPGERRTIALVGPTGVGKTTTTAKIAARAVLDSRLRVALVTVDTYRIAGADQLARYGEILGVPCLVAGDRKELAAALARCADADLVLVDTAGRSDPEAVARQAELVRTIPGVELALVLSAATGWRELAAVATRYAALEPEALVLSKVDEAAGPAGALSAVARLRAPVACIADGQRVPEDLHEATGGRLVDLVAGTGRPARRT